MAYRPEGFRQGDRMMNPEFARRIRSFLRREEWWDVVQAIKPLIPRDRIWQTVIAGIDEMTDEDYQFAQSINWNVSPAFDLSKISAYEYDNWWYTEVPAEFRPQANLAVTGKVRLANVTSDKEARDAARAFTQAHIELENVVGFNEAQTVVTLSPPSVKGMVLLK
jgi:hypothetical protein